MAVNLELSMIRASLGSKQKIPIKGNVNVAVYIYHTIWSFGLPSMRTGYPYQKDKNEYLSYGFSKLNMTAFNDGLYNYG